MEKEKSILKKKAINMINVRQHSMDLKSEKEMVQSLNSGGIIIDVSPGWLFITGYEKEEVIGHFFTEFLISDSLSKVRREFPHLKDYGFVDNVQLKLKRKDGVVIEIALNGTSKYSHDGEFKQTFCELRTLEYYMNSAYEINQILIREKFLKMVEYIKVNIVLILLNDQGYDYYSALREVLNEPPEIIRVTIEPSPISDYNLDENEKSIVKYAKEYIEKNIRQEDNNIFIIKKSNDDNLSSLTENEDYTLIIQIKDDIMPNKERILIIDFNSPVQLLNEWEESFISISQLIRYAAQWIKVNMENKNLILELKKMSEMDKLTNIYNRMMLDKVLLKQKESYDRYKKRCSVIIMDIDFFKRVNDTYGHNVGDKVLYEIADLLKNNISKKDVVGRWGGEEFLIICKGADLSKAMILAESLRKAIECYSFTEVGHITASFGVSEFYDETSIEQVVERADKALYKSKRNGRNRVSD
ncbi:MAG: diguanylate cyclase [Proteocatella sp.]